MKNEEYNHGGHGVPRSFDTIVFYSSVKLRVLRGKILWFLLFAVLFSSCNYGEIGGADQTEAYYPGETVFTEQLNFLCGVWYSHMAGIGRLDGYRIRKWSDLSVTDKAKAQALFPGIDVNNLKTYSTQYVPQDSDYVFLFDDTAYEQEENYSENNESWGFGYMGLVRAINIFNGDKNRGAVIIEYFKGASPAWLSDTQDLTPDEKPFFGIYYKVLDHNTVQMANPVDLAAMYAKKHYYTEQGTMVEAVGVFDVENEAEFISWGVVFPQDRE